MAASILSIGTAVPPARVSQTIARDVFASQPGLSRITQRLIHAAFDASAIDHRNTVLADLVSYATGAADPGAEHGMSLAGAEGTILAASTGARNAAYIRLAPALFAAAAAQALVEGGIAPDEVTHVVTVSCTGMFAPGPDFRLVKDLGLPGTVERYHIGFMGCAAALPGLRAAARICAAQPDAVVLVAAAELCTLHIRSSEDPQQIVAASVFADGAAAAIVSERSRGTGPRLELQRFGTVLTSQGESDMVWTIGDDGFDMILTAEVPRIIGREIRDAVGSFLGADTPDLWAVHPGGRSVLDRVESGLSLEPDALEASRSVLRRQGNMSSATILFILRELLCDEAVPDGALIAALAFGPGLTVESALLTRTAADRA
ncbi:type III polyketide synthase [Microbacterium deminutum]|uniref:Type III polyketide synthase n=1 Tax=Microbacterium deminutum TaxID=344164 RepID=A0ABP5C1R2_9MICO